MSKRMQRQRKDRGLRNHFIERGEAAAPRSLTCALILALMEDCRCTSRRDHAGAAEAPTLRPFTVTNGAPEAFVNGDDDDAYGDWICAPLLRCANCGLQFSEAKG